MIKNLLENRAHLQTGKGRIQVHTRKQPAQHKN